MPKFLIDEDLPRSMASVLRANNYDAKDIRDCGLRGADDQKIFEFAQSEKSVIITGDKGFGNLLRFPLGAHFGIVITKYSNYCSTQTLNKFLLEKLPQLSPDDFNGNLIVIDEIKIRIRRKS